MALCIKKVQLLFRIVGASNNTQHRTDRYRLWLHRVHNALKLTVTLERCFSKTIS